VATERTRRRFTPEFKKDAVALVTEQGYTIVKATRADLATRIASAWPEYSL